MPLHPSRLLAALGAVLVVLVATSALADPPTMSSLWPNQDGLCWTYAQHYENHSPDSPMTVDNHTRIFFDGTVVAPTAIDAQYLHQDATPGAVAVTADFASTVRDPFLRQLWMARPDLRGKIQRMVEDAACPENRPADTYTLFLDGELAFRKTADEIAAWRCNLADTRAWLWLVSDVSVGNTFTLQLVPDLAADVFLHGTIAAIEPVTVPAGTFDTSVRVDYVVDYGTSACTDPSGNPVGTFNSQSRGHVHYVPDLGPVECGEEFIEVAQQTGTCFPADQVGQALSQASLQLERLPVPTRPASWGAVKLHYR